MNRNSEPSGFTGNVRLLLAAMIGQVTDGVSLDAQQARIRAWCDANGYALLELREDAGAFGLSFGDFELFYPEVYRALEGDRFFFVLVPPALCSRAAALAWPLIFHEMGHVVDHHFGKARGIHPDYPNSTSKLKQFAKHGHQKAQEKLWAQEYTSDFLAVLIA
jgi:hypothetical protein